MKSIREETIRRLLETNNILMGQLAIDMTALRNSLKMETINRFQSTVYRDLEDRWALISEQQKEIEKIMNMQILAQAEE